jgi:hypothetical protein
MTDDVIDAPEAGVLHVGYRRPGVAKAGLFVAIRRLGGPIFVRVVQLASPLEEVLAAARHWSAAPVRHHHSLGRNPVKISH